MLTTPGRAAAISTAGALVFPEADSTVTTSLSSIPNSAAVRGLISTQQPHTTEVIGSGSSCNQGRLAPTPVPSAELSNGWSEKGYSAASRARGSGGCTSLKNVRSAGGTAPLAG